jgi:hypothetical protein
LMRARKNFIPAMDMGTRVNYNFVGNDFDYTPHIQLLLQFGVPVETFQFRESQLNIVGRVMMLNGWPNAPPHADRAIQLSVYGDPTFRKQEISRLLSGVALPTALCPLILGYLPPLVFTTDMNVAEDPL